MARLTWQRALLPLTIAVMLVAFTERAGTLAKAATDPSNRSTAPSAPANAPAPAAVAGKPADVSPGGIAPAATAGIAAPDEAGALAELKRRRDALDKRAAALDERAELLAAAEQKLQAKLDQLGVLQARLEQGEQQRRQRVAANWNGLVKTYEAMKPDEAATIFNVLDTDVLLEVLDRMNERKEAQVLAAMLPERARQATQMLARKRLQENGADAAQLGSRPGVQPGTGTGVEAGDQHG